QESVDGRYEAAIGVLLGLAALTKLYPAFLAAPLWSVRDAQGRRRWRWPLPAAMFATVALGYLVYSAPGVNTLGFLAAYNREAFNTAPGVWWLIEAGLRLRLPWHQTVTLALAAAMILISLALTLFPARTPRQAVLRCAWPIGAYILINANLFSWYVLWMLPLVAVTFTPWRPSAAFAWWAFSGLVALSYTFFLEWERVAWAINLQFYALYALLFVALVYRVVSRRRRDVVAWRAAH
ncbi:MAG: hypothetical protein IT323_07900, partial [Anaerolineae bacterium]|nr:hypothetical protein [Anaerolineae bacterium]